MIILRRFEPYKCPSFVKFLEYLLTIIIEVYEELVNPLTLISQFITNAIFAFLMYKESMSKMDTRVTRR